MIHKIDPWCGTFRFFDKTCSSDQPLRIIHNWQKGINHSMHLLKLSYNPKQALMKHFFESNVTNMSMNHDHSSICIIKSVSDINFMQT